MASTRLAFSGFSSPLTFTGIVCALVSDQVAGRRVYPCLCC